MYVVGTEYTQNLNKIVWQEIKQSLEKQTKKQIMQIISI